MKSQILFSFVLSLFVFFNSGCSSKHRHHGDHGAMKCAYCEKEKSCCKDGGKDCCKDGCKDCCKDGKCDKKAKGDCGCSKGDKKGDMKKSEGKKEKSVAAPAAAATPAPVETDTSKK